MLLLRIIWLYEKDCQNKSNFLSFHDNISLPCISEAATGLIRLHVTVHQKDRNQDQCGRPRRQKAQSLHPFNALWSIISNPIRKLFNWLETLGNTKAQNYIFWEDNKMLKTSSETSLIDNRLLYKPKNLQFQLGGKFK